MSTGDTRMPPTPPGAIDPRLIGTIEGLAYGDKPRSAVRAFINRIRRRRVA